MTSSSRSTKRAHGTLVTLPLTAHPEAHLRRRSRRRSTLPPGPVRQRGLILLTIGLLFGIPLILLCLAIDEGPLVLTVFILITACPLTLALAGFLEFFTALSLRDPSPPWSRTRATVRILLRASLLIMLLAISIMVLIGGLGRAGLY